MVAVSFYHIRTELGCGSEDGQRRSIGGVLTLEGLPKLEEDTGM